METKGLVVLSGGQDSTTCLFWAKHYYDEVHALTFDYGQRHRIEIESAIKVAELAGVASHEIVNVEGTLKSASPLTSNNELETYPDYETMDKIIGDRRELTFVPMRNALFLTIAANRAEALGCEAIVTGVCEQDGANYSDCRSTFINAAMTFINEALGNPLSSPIKILTPLLTLTKAESIALARKIPGCMEALAFSHTCYAGEYPPCGKCHACVLRAQGFKEAGIADPLITRANDEACIS